MLRIAAFVMTLAMSLTASADWRDACKYKGGKTPAELREAFGVDGVYLGDDGDWWYAGFDFGDGTGAVVKFSLLSAGVEFSNMSVDLNSRECRSISNCYWNGVCRTNPVCHIVGGHTVCSP